MFLVPYHRVAIHSPKPPGAIADNLLRATAPRQPWFKSLYGKFDFVGAVSQTDFRLTPVIRGRNSYAPLLRGRIEASGTGTEIRIVESLQPVVLVLLPLLFVALPLGLAGFCRDFVIWLGMLFVLHCVLYFIAFLPAARRAEATIRRLAG
jgi:hypothetical protein